MDAPLPHLAACLRLASSPQLGLNAAFSYEASVGWPVWGPAGTYRWKWGGKNRVALWSVLRVGALSQQHDRR